MSKNFHISDIVTVISGKMVSTRGMDGVYDILRYLCGEAIYTNQIPRVLNECAPVVLSQHPKLAEAKTDGLSPKNHAEYVALWAAEFGESLPLEPVTEGQHERIDAMSEMAERMHPDRIVTIVKDD